MIAIDRYFGLKTKKVRSDWQGITKITSVGRWTLGFVDGISFSEGYISWIATFKSDRFLRHPKNGMKIIQSDTRIFIENLMVEVPTENWAPVVWMVWVKIISEIFVRILSNWFRWKFPKICFYSPSASIEKSKLWNTNSPINSTFPAFEKQQQQQDLIFQLPPTRRLGRTETWKAA